VTIPHKEEVIKKLTEADDAVRGIGAANTVVIEGKKRRGFNTDHQAAIDSLEAAVAEQPSSRRGSRAGRRWCSAPAAWARPSSTA